jgi:predicted TPR repeat methyltransferase
MNTKDYYFWNQFWNELRTDVPWETNEIDKNLTEFIEKEKKFENALEIGCGSGINSKYLSNHCQNVTGIDISTTAIELAILNNSQDNIQFNVLDFFEIDDKNQYDFIFDRGCLHGIISFEMRKKFVEKIEKIMTIDGKWFSLIGSAEDVFNNEGPPRWAISDVIACIEPYLKITEIKACHLKNKNEILSSAWAVTVQKRRFPLSKTQ